MSDCQLSASYVVLLGMDGNKFFHKVVKDGIGMLSNLMRGWGGGRRNTPMVGQKRIAPEITVKHNQWVALGRERGSNEKGNYYLQRKEIIVSNVCMDSHTCLADCEDGITVIDKKRRRTIIDGACIDGLTVTMEIENVQ